MRKREAKRTNGKVRIWERETRRESVSPFKRCTGKGFGRGESKERIRKGET